ncbi:MAG: transporter component [Deltaproteobacteria bacterium]|jgi:TRAP-type C4-dicarboxylate transport system permease small subunit|nr:transporter component [Deltaproteobacteria bacterium]MBP1740398.1 transporter component [Deltaproteobacteria bacterium]
MGLLRERRIVLSGVNALINVLKGIAYVTLSVMVLVTTANVFGRYIFKKPILGEYDMIELGMAILGGIAMFLAAVQRHHVSVDVLTVRFSRRVQLLLGSGACLLGFLTWALLSYRAFLDGLSNLENGSRTATLFILQGPFEIVLAIGILLLCFTLLAQAFRPEGSEEKTGGGPRL